MRMRVTRQAGARIFSKGVWALLLLLALLSGLGGCLSLGGPEAAQPNPEIAVQTAEYGTVTQVTSARMKDKEIRLGDIAITVDTDDGRVVVVIQPEDDIYKEGDRVRVIRDGRGFIRVQLVI